MKGLKNRSFLILLMVVFFACCKDKTGLSFNNKSEKEEIIHADQHQPRIVFSKLSHSFGKIEKTTSDTILFDFTFTNTGVNPLVIKKVDVSCGCLSTSYSNYPIKKDSIGFVRVIVNPKLLNGAFNKRVFVTSNSEDEVNLLKIKGTVY